MKIFISWSGEKSKQVGLLFRKWLSCVLQASQPWMSDIDIDRGANWFNELNKELENCSNGIICITRENISRPWMLFEAGALAKGLSTSRICTFLIDLHPKDVGEPLSQFNHTLPTKEGLFKLVETLNKCMDKNALPPRTLETVFETYWNLFYEAFNNIISVPYGNDHPNIRSSADMMDEIITSLRRVDKRISIIEERIGYAPLNRGKGGIGKVERALLYDYHKLINNFPVDNASSKSEDSSKNEDNASF